MSTGRGELVNPQRRLPEIALPDVPGGEPQRLRGPGRRAPVLVLVHGHACAACAAYVQSLAAEREMVTEWDGRVLVVAPEPVAEAAGFPHPDPFPLLADPERRLPAALGIQPPGVVIADQWGQVHEAHEAGEDHAFLDVDEVVEWLRFLAIQCPECQGEAF